MEFSRTARTVINVVVIICGILIPTHILCCVWYQIGLWSGSDTGSRWVASPVGPYGDAISDFGLSYEYLCSFHWTAAQITLGASDVVPTNSVERLFTIFVLMVGLLMGSTLVSIFSALVLGKVLSKQAWTELRDDMRQFLSQNHVAHKLCVRVMTQVENRAAASTHLLEENVKALDLLTPSLCRELIVEIRRPTLVTHPLFQLWGEVNVKAVAELCEKAVGIKAVAPKEEVFTVGSQGAEAYCVMRGRLTYAQRPGFLFHVYSTKTFTIHDKAWLCEGALWSKWIHVGDLTAVTHCSLLSLDAVRLAEVMNTEVSIRTLTSSYARNFHVQLVATGPPFAPYPSDLYVPNTEVNELLSRHVSQGRLRQALSHGTLVLSESQLAKLEEEIAEEKCTIQAAKEGIRRVAFVMALRIQHPSGSKFYQVGKKDKEDKIKVACQLPGGKRARGELPQDAVKRILAEQLDIFQDNIAFEETERMTEMKDSPQYGIPTLYLRDVTPAVLEDPDLPIPIASFNGDQADCCYGTIMGIFPRDVFVLPDCGKDAFYAWLDDREFEILQRPESKEPLRTWLACLGPPTDGRKLERVGVIRRFRVADVHADLLMCTETLPDLPFSAEMADVAISV